jgi:hypothetical protein
MPLPSGRPKLETTVNLEDREMESIVTPTEGPDRGDKEALAVRAWRTEQLRRLGLPYLLAETFADLVDWHAVADLVERGCSLSLALDIVR